ncbi:MAG: HlyD family efflux transporter periplasmic adaptor subunit [Steroidobacteraceae bacterium]
MKIAFHRAARTDPGEIGGLKVNYGAARRNLARWRWWAILAVVLSPVVYLVVGVIGTTLTRQAPGTVVLEQYEARAPLAGQVSELNANVGDAVIAGQVLARVAAPGAAAVSLRVDTGSDAPSVEGKARELLEQELALRVRMLDYQRDRRRRIDDLLAAGAATAAERNEAQYAVDQAESAWLSARTALAEFVGASRRAGVVAAQSGASGVADATVVATQPGRVLDAFATAGEFVAQGQTLFTVGSSDSAAIIAYVAPEYAAELAVGSRATIRFPDGATIDARIAEVPKLTRRMPPDLVDQFGVRPMTVVLRLEQLQALNDRQSIHGLPVKVRFHYGFESSAAGRRLGELLGWLGGLI